MSLATFYFAHAELNTVKLWFVIENFYVEFGLTKQICPPSKISWSTMNGANYFLRKEESLLLLNKERTVTIEKKKNGP